MKCGICRTEQGGAYLLADHKRREHPGEYRDQIARMQAGKQAKQDERNDLIRRSREAGQAASRVTVQKAWAGDGIEVKDTYTGSKSRDLRYPEPVAFETYKHYLEQAEALLEAAWADGTPVPEEDLQAVRQAVAEVT
jgi:hypothetical protein